MRKEKAVASDISLLNQRISVGTMLYTEAKWSQRLLTIAQFVLDHGGKIRAPLSVSGQKGAGKNNLCGMVGRTSWSACLLYEFAVFVA